MDQQNLNPKNSKSTQIPFKGSSWTLSISHSNNNLTISLSNQHLSYQANYSNSYIENLTQKTGNFKKFQIFIDMLTNAIQKNHSSLSLEILTLNDLQTNQLQTNPKPNNTIDDKLYLILTYAVAFDRVHYPLPLQLQNSLDNSSQLKIKSLEIDYANALKELSMLMKENDRLQYELKQKSKTDLQIQNLPDFELKVSKISRDLKKIDPGTCRHYKIHQNLESIIIDLLVSYYCKLMLGFGIVR
ncbi:hypothetical protein BC833DRAFT_602901 [Globomyces pollinis-pini]|nr:hypothetical protein BC833DRAFT_602901 [Globomyces pollinis-pini]